MARGVTIKGTGNGVILVLDADTPFDTLRGEIAERIRSSAHFLGNARFPIIIRGRDLSEEEQQEVLEMIRQNAHVTVTELRVEPPVEPKHLTADEIFSKESEEERTNQQETDPTIRTNTFGDTEELSSVDRAILRELEKQMSGEFAVMHAGPVKNGAVIRSEYSLIIMGDVRKGGRVEANGSIIVLGNLLGEAVAGAEGNRSAIVVSNYLHPQELSIGSLSGYRMPWRVFRRPFGRKRLMEVACVKNGEVVRMAYSDFICDNAMQ